MLIEYSNLDSSRGPNPLGKVVFFASILVFLAIPASLIALGFFSNQPTGTLLSPLPQKVLSEEITPTPAQTNQPIIASDNNSTPSAVDTEQNSNSSDHTATLPAGQTELLIEDKNITTNTQILIIPGKNDSSVYFVKSKGKGFFILSADSSSQQNRTVDYQVVGL